MSKKAAILFFGQPRISTDYNYNLASIERFKQANEGVIFDTFVHQWILPSELSGETYHYARWCANTAIPALRGMEQYMIDTYKPLKYKFEEQRTFNPDEFLHPETFGGWMTTADLSNMISQLYSVASVCNLIGELDVHYEWFILLRTDSEIGEDTTSILLKDLDVTKTVFGYSDFIQVFGPEVLEIYKGLLKEIRDNSVQRVSAEALRSRPIEQRGIKYPHQPIGINAYVLRSLRTPELFIDRIPHYANSCEPWVSTSGVYVRKTSEGKYLCKFPPKSSPRTHQWIGIHVTSNSKTVTWKTRRYGEEGADWKVQTSGPTYDDGSGIVFLLAFDDVLSSEEIMVELEM